MSSHILESTFQPYQWLTDAEQQLACGHSGASASFIGTMRNHHQDQTVTRMILEHYPAMTERYLSQLEAEARDNWPLNECLIVHRVGTLLPGEAIMLIACWSTHRRAALDACNWLVESLKFKAPFWKKEQTESGEFWVQSNTDGY